MKSAYLPIGIVIGSCGLFSYAFSQDADQGDGFMLGEIVIEGGKVDRTYKDTFGSVGVIGGADVEAQGVDDLREGFNLLGNVRWNEANRGGSGFSIRGVNSDGLTQPENNNPVTSVIIDGATQSLEATRRGSRGIWDVEQVEVFRGPQSAIQGRAALAGAVIVSTKDPTYEFEAGVQGTLGQLEQRDAAFYLSGPIVPDQLAFRLSGEHRMRSNDIDYNSEFAQEFEDDEFTNIRGKLLFEPAAIEGLSFLVTASRTLDRPSVNAVNGADFFEREFSVGPTSTIEVYEADNRNFILEASYDFNDRFTLKSVSSLIYSETEISSPSGQFYQRDETRSGEDFTQDLRLEIGQSEDRLSGVIGGFFGRFTLPRESLVSIERPGLPTFVIQDLKSDNQTENLAIYADLQFRPLGAFSDLSILFGGRLMRETVTNDFDDRSPADNDIKAEETFQEFLPKLGLAYDLTDNSTVSLVYQRGYRSGFTARDTIGTYTVDPEFADSVELSYKAQADDGRWNFGATGFFTRFTEQQITQTVNLDVGGVSIPFARTVNAGESESYGIEIDGRYNSGIGLSIFGALGLLHTEFVDLVVSGTDFSGNEFPEAPTLTASAGLSYEHSSGFFATANVSYTDGFFSNGSIENDPIVEVDSYVVTNASVGYSDDRVKATLFVDNLFDEEYLTSIDKSGTEASIGAPRRVGAEVLFTF